MGVVSARSSSQPGGLGQSLEPISLNSLTIFPPHFKFNILLSALSQQTFARALQHSCHLTYKII